MINIEENRDLLTNLKQNLAIYKESIKEVAEEILDNKVSKYPVFVASRERVPIGKMIIDKEELALDWNIFASTLEEFLKKQIISNQKLDFFRQQFKNPREYICLFTIIGNHAGFIYVPYDHEEY